MANQILDNRTSLFFGDSTTADNGGDWALSSTSEQLDTTTFIEGTGAIAEQMTDSRRTLIWDQGTTSDMTDVVFYVWVNCGVVGLLESVANNGFCVRFTGPSNADYFEVTVGGNDSWPIAINGGWVQFVVDISAAEAAPDLTGGTPPAITAIQGFGISAICTAMTKVSDNTWVDAGWTLAANTPGIIIEGRNAGTTDWSWQDVFDQLTVESGAIKLGTAGSFVLNTSIQWGINDTSTHGFTDTDAIVLFEEQGTMVDGQYFMQALGNSGGTTRVIMGVKTGTGDAATGARGVTFVGSATDPVRCNWDLDDANLDDIGFYGCTFTHQGDFLLNNSSVSSISSTFLDCSSALISDCRDFLRNRIINAATADGVAFISTNDLGDMVRNEFEFSDGHAVELITTPAKVTSQADVGNLYSGYGATGTNDAEYYNNTGAGLVTVSVSGGGNGADYRNGTSATTSVQNTVTLAVTVQDESAAVIPYATVRISNSSTGALISEGTANNLGVYTDSTYNYAGDVGVNVDVRKNSPGATRYLSRRSPGIIESGGLSVTVSLTADTISGELPMVGILQTGAQSENESGDAVQTVNIDLPLGVSRKLITGVMYWDSTTNLSPSTVTYDGNAMTLEASASTFEQEGANFHEIATYRYDIPDSDSGVKDVVVTWSANVAVKGICFALVDDAVTGAVSAATSQTGDNVTSNPIITLDREGWRIAFLMTDDMDSPTSTGTATPTIRRSDEVVTGTENMLVLTAPPVTGAGNETLGADYGANNKTWVMGGVKVATN
jgi:hypothetical protein